MVDWTEQMRNVRAFGEKLKEMGVSESQSHSSRETALVNAAEWAFKYFYCQDKANAAIHCALVKFSPITFRLAFALALGQDEAVSEEVHEVMVDRQKYEEDPGR